MTPAQRKWLLAHQHRGGTLHKWTGGIGGMTYVMAGNLEKLGFIAIKDGPNLGWPYGWESTTLTDAGRSALSPAQPLLKEGE